mgnify:CR=1 FL=1
MLVLHHKPAKGFLIKRWLNRPFFITNMTKKQQKIRKLITARLVAALLFTALAPVADAGILDWFSGLGNEVFVSNQISGDGFTYLTANSQSVSVDKANPTQVDPVLIEGIFLVANHSPSIKKGVSQKIVAKDSPPAVIQELIVPISAYSSTTDQTDDSPFITAWNTPVRDGIVAANFLPFGTKIKIPEIFGDKILTVEDRMNKRYWHKMDIWFPDRASALQFGVKILKIQILES